MTWGPRPASSLVLVLGAVMQSDANRHGENGGKLTVRSFAAAGGGCAKVCDDAFVAPQLWDIRSPLGRKSAGERAAWHRYPACGIGLRQPSAFRTGAIYRLFGKNGLFSRFLRALRGHFILGSY